MEYIDSLSVYRQSEPNWRRAGQVNLGISDLRIVLLILVLKVKLLREHGHKDLDLPLGQSLAEIDATASMEGNVAVYVALFTRRSQTQCVFVVESLRQKLCRSLPLG